MTRRAVLAHAAAQGLPRYRARRVSVTVDLFAGTPEAERRDGASTASPLRGRRYCGAGDDVRALAYQRSNPAPILAAHRTPDGSRDGGGDPVDPGLESSRRRDGLPILRGLGEIASISSAK